MVQQTDTTSSKQNVPIQRRKVPPRHSWHNHGRRPRKTSRTHPGTPPEQKEKKCTCGWCRLVEDRTACKNAYKCSRKAKELLGHMYENWNPLNPPEEEYLTNPSPEEVRKHNTEREKDGPWLFNPFQAEASLTDSFRIFTTPMEIDNGPPGRMYARNEQEAEVTVYTDGSCLNQGSTEVRAGSGVWFGNNDERNISERVPGRDQSNQIAELYAILLAVKTAPADAPLVIKSDSRFAIDGLTKNLQDWENKGWIGVKHARLFKTTTAWLRFRGQPTTLHRVKGHSGIEGNEGADELAGEGARLPRPEDNKIDHHQPPGQTLPGARLSNMSQKTLYQGIRRRKTLKNRATTTRILDLTRDSAALTLGHRPTDQLIWHSIRSEDFSRNIRDYMWKSMHGALKIGDYWSNIPGLEDRATCTTCGQIESMDHILARCESEARETIWKLTNELWTKRHDEPFEPSLGNVLGYGLANFTIENKPLTGKNRLYKILISESAFLIWKLRCEREIGGKTHSATEIHNRWVGTINSRLNMDCVLTDTRAYDRRAMSGQKVKGTWHKCLMNEKDLPDDWRKRTGVLVGIATKSTVRVPHEAG